MRGRDSSSAAYPVLHTHVSVRIPKTIQIRTRVSVSPAQGNGDHVERRETSPKKQKYPVSPSVLYRPHPVLDTVKNKALMKNNCCWQPRSLHDAGRLRHGGRNCYMKKNTLIGASGHFPKALFSIAERRK